MRVRKIAKQLKKFHANVTFDKDGYPVCGYKVAHHVDKVSYIMRMTRKHYFGLRSKYPVRSIMWQLYTHKACSYDLYDEILEFWGWKEQ
jgi:hypothetical protein